jgi:uncharacterized protein
MNPTGTPETKVRQAAARGMLAFYKSAISPVLHALALMPGGCAYQPSCSEYAAIAIAEHGIFRGGLMALGRVLRCHPLHPGGFDPVPAKPDGGTGYSGEAIS